MCACIILLCVAAIKKEKERNSKTECGTVVLYRRKQTKMQKVCCLHLFDGTVRVLTCAGEPQKYYCSLCWLPDWFKLRESVTVRMTNVRLVLVNVVWESYIGKQSAIICCACRCWSDFVCLTFYVSPGVDQERTHHPIFENKWSMNTRAHFRITVIL